jgi:hypothetical protein
MVPDPAGEQPDVVGTNLREVAELIIARDRGLLTETTGERIEIRAAGPWNVTSSARYCMAVSKSPAYRAVKYRSTISRFGSLNLVLRRTQAPARLINGQRNIHCE